MLKLFANNKMFINFFSFFPLSDGEQRIENLSSFSRFLFFPVKLLSKEQLAQSFSG